LQAAFLFAGFWTNQSLSVLVETCGRAGLKSLELADIVGLFVGQPYI
jgi:hypothetical protein